MHWIQVVPPGSKTSLTLVTWFETMPPGSLRGLVLSSDDLQADYEKLRARGVEFEGPPQRQPWATETVFHDPDGNQIVLQQASESPARGASIGRPEFLIEVFLSTMNVSEAYFSLKDPAFIEQREQSGPAAEQRISDIFQSSNAETRTRIATRVQDACHTVFG